MQKCPRCGSATQPHQIGCTKAGSPRYKCQACQGRYTPKPNHHGDADEVRQRAVRMYLDGLNFRRIGRLLGVHHTSVRHWVTA
jgi:transposase-like protein